MNSRRSMSTHSSRFTLFSIIPWVIGAVFITVLVGWLIIGTLAWPSVDAVNNRGLKQVLEQVWCGPTLTDDCKLPEVTTK